MKIINIGNRVLNNYIIETSKGYLVVDTGYAGNYLRFCKGLLKNKIVLSEIKYIFLTHAHDDHAGFLNELIRDTDAKLIMHMDAPQRLLGGHNCYDGGGCSNKLAKYFINLMGVLGNPKHTFPVVPIKDNTLLFDGSKQFFRMEGIEIDIIPLPGHTKDQIGLLMDDGRLLCGDAAMNGFPSVKRNIIWIENLMDYINSWDIMIQSKTEYIYPSHGKPFPKDDLMKYRKHLNILDLHTILRYEKYRNIK
ncbi:MAG: MBL fold metallo-hydrolase [Bacteroides sp.]|nr:MBL fold metallo-hydrolase [Bacteroides sp.]